MKTIKGRNQYVDILRGIAMLLVVLGHTMTGSTKDSENSVLFNIVWSLQMPLFILISGYVSRYSRSLITASAFLNYVKRRTISYILPWIVWSFVIRGFIFKQKSFLNVKWLLWHMDSGYWFLITIWTISIIFGVSLFFSEKIFKNEKLKQLSVCVFYFMGMGVLILIGKFMGMNFFAIKLTLYYMPFYFVGYLYGQYYDKLSSLKNFKLIYDVVVTVCFAIWIYALFNFKLYNMSDTGFNIILRAGISVAGCVSVSGLLKDFLNVPYTSKIMGGGISHRKKFNGNISCALSSAESDKASGCSTVHDADGQNYHSFEFYGNCKSFVNNNRDFIEKSDYEHDFLWKKIVSDFILFIGKNSLEIYLIHGFLLNILKSNCDISFKSAIGILTVSGNYLITVTLCLIIIELLNTNCILKNFLWAKK